MKNSVTNMVLVIVKLFNKILQLGKFPKQWNISHISSVFKSGDPNDCNNYRGICVSSCLGKPFTSLLQNRLTLFLKEHDLHDRHVSFLGHIILIRSQPVFDFLSFAACLAKKQQIPIVFGLTRSRWIFQYNFCYCGYI
jgi:hypothetical protein